MPMKKHWSPTHTPWPWVWWTSNSWNRLKRDNLGQTENVLEPFVSRADGHPDCIVSPADMALIAAAPDLFDALVSAVTIELQNHMPLDQAERIVSGHVRLPDGDWLDFVTKGLAAIAAARKVQP